MSNRTALVLYGSETGTAQDIAGELGRLTERLHFSTRVTDLDSITINELCLFDIVLFATSTTGQGELPDNAQTFWKRLRSRKLSSHALADVNFASFGLGDSSYPQFNWAHRKLHARLLQIGAHECYQRGESDEQHPEGVEGQFLPWSTGLRQHLIQAFPLPAPPLTDDVFLRPKWALECTVLSINDDEVFHNQSGYWDHFVPKQGSILASLTAASRVTPIDHWQDVRLLDFAIPVKDYGPGDVLTIFPKNFKEDVDQLITSMDWTDMADCPMVFNKLESSINAIYHPPPFTLDQPITLRQLLTNYLDITAIPRRSFFATMAHFTKDETQRERLIEFTQLDLVDELYDYTTRPRRSIIEVLQEFYTVKIPFKWVASVFPTIRGRQFSIASGGSLKRHKDQQGRVQLLVAIVKYRTVIKRIRQGLCTRYLAALPLGSNLSVLLTRGGMKYDLNRPAIMIGPGTGIAPLRSMIYERKYHNVVSSTPQIDQLLFFGGRNRSADFFFEDDWKQLNQKIGLKVVTAFSRDQKAKIYVQDVIREQSRLVSELLLRGAVVYICGSSGKMPQAVRESIVDALEKENTMQHEDAEAYMKQLERTGRYQQETW